MSVVWRYCKFWGFFIFINVRDNKCRASILSGPKVPGILGSLRGRVSCHPNSKFDLGSRSPIVYVLKMWLLNLLLFLLEFGTASNIRRLRPHSHAKINIENFKHQQVGNPSVLAFNLFTDDRGEEKKNIFLHSLQIQRKRVLQIKEFRP